MNAAGCKGGEVICETGLGVRWSFGGGESFELGLCEGGGFAVVEDECCGCDVGERRICRQEMEIEECEDKRYAFGYTD